MRRKIVKFIKLQLFTAFLLFILFLFWQNLFAQINLFSENNHRAEFDLIGASILKPAFILQIGYSQMLLALTLRVLKVRKQGKTSNWVNPIPRSR